MKMYLFRIGFESGSMDEDTLLSVIVDDSIRERDIPDLIRQKYPKYVEEFCINTQFRDDVSYGVEESTLLVL